MLKFGVFYLNTPYQHSKRNFHWRLSPLLVDPKPQKWKDNPYFLHIPVIDRHNPEADANPEAELEHGKIQHHSFLGFLDSNQSSRNIIVIIRPTAAMVLIAAWISAWWCPPWLCQLELVSRLAPQLRCCR